LHLVYLPLQVGDHAVGAFMADAGGPLTGELAVVAANEENLLAFALVRRASQSRRQP
jgi:hypothetical protein